MNKMRYVSFAVSIIAVAMALTAPVSAAEKAKLTKAPIVEVGLFKNGYALVTHEFETAPGVSEYIIRGAPEAKVINPGYRPVSSYIAPGVNSNTVSSNKNEYEFTNDGLPKPVHGTLWVESGSPVSLQFFQYEEKLTKTEAIPDSNVLDGLMGRKVHVFLADGRELDVTLRNAPTSSLVAMETSEGTEIIRSSDIKKITINDRLPSEKVEEMVVKRPAMRVKVADAKKRQTVRYSYLAYGISWAPSYRLDLSEGGRGGLSMKTVIRNELADIENADVFLISGFPSIKFINVISPLDANTTWSNFFSSLSSGLPSYASRARESMMTQAVMMNAPAPYAESGAAMAPDMSGDFDIQFYPMGKQSVGLNESVMLPVAAAPLEYERVVEWFIPDNVDQYGNYIKPGTRPHEEIQDDVWDAVKFDNPFDFAMTTAAISVYQNGRLQGQSQAFWTAQGKEISTRITKALSIKVEHEARELPERRTEVTIAGSRYVKSSMEATVTAKNLRSRKESVVIKRRFSGKLLKADGNPETTLLPEGATRLNERNEIVWETDLAPGQEVEYTYTYEVVF